jgi:hypothetical protein
MRNAMLEKLKQNDVNFKTGKKDVENIYYDFCGELKKKYGILNTDFDDKTIIRRGKEWLDIHHICEIDGDATNGLDDIASRTSQALKENDFEELRRLKPYNKKDQLIYANKVEHFILHYLIDIRRGKHISSGGCWFILPNIFDIEFKQDYKMPYLIEIQKNKNHYYDENDFRYLIELAILLRNERNNKDYDEFIKEHAEGAWVSDPKKYYKLINVK